MKFLLSLLLIAAAAAAGYHFEPELRGFLTGSPQVTVASIPPAAVVPPSEIHPGDYAPEQLPKQIHISAGATVALEGSGMKMKAETSTQVELVRIEGEQVIFNAGAGNASVAIKDTDLLQLLANVPKKANSPTPAPAIVESTPPPAPPSPEPTLPSEVTPPAPAESTPPQAEASLPGDSMEATPQTAETPEAPKAPAETVMTPVVAAMQESLQNHEVTEINFSDIVEWTTGPDEVINGTTMQTGFANCETTTVFGSKILQAKAYIQNNKVIRWVWPKSGVQIK